MNLTVACGDYDRTRRLLDGTISIRSHRLTVSSFSPEEMFRRAFDGAEFDISELSISLFMQRIDQRTCPYVGIPVFPSRAFRHSAIYVRTDGDVIKPDDLRGRTVGVRSYLNTAALVVRGLLSDSYGIPANEISWRVGDVDQIEREIIPIPKMLRPVDIQAAPRGATLADMLIAKEIDAIIHYSPPRGFGREPAPIRQLFADPGTAEREYFRSTGIFPIMHLIGIRRTLLESDPSLALQVFDAFGQAKDAAIADLWSQSSPKISLPWLNADVAKTVELAGPDFWPYGVRKNRAALESITRYGFEQGLTAQQLSFEEFFVPSLLDS